MLKNEYTELASVTRVHSVIGSVGQAQERLNYFCHNMMLPEFTDEMLEFVDLSTLNDRMGDSRIISKKYLSTVIFSTEQGKNPDWTQCSFIECNRGSNGKLTHVIFATQSIEESKAKELETMKVYRDEMEIAGALSRDYPDVVLLDLANDTAVTIKLTRLPLFAFIPSKKQKVRCKRCLDDI